MSEVLNLIETSTMEQHNFMFLFRETASGSGTSSLDELDREIFQIVSEISENIKFSQDFEFEYYF